MDVKMKLTGGLDLEWVLAELPRSTSKSVARRAMKDELLPVAAMANAFWPGSADDVFRVGSKLRRSQPRGKRSKSIVSLYVGAPGGPGGSPEAHLIEFGTGPRWQDSTGRYLGSVAPTPMLQPAWDAHKSGLFERLGRSLWLEIEKTMARRAKRAQT